jgi:hypothetical protein
MAQDNFPTDEQASSGANTSRAPQNLEEARSRRSRTSPPTGAYCPKCEGPSLVDEKKLHKCARCRSEVLPEVAAAKRRRQQAEAAENARKSEPSKK